MEFQLKNSSTNQLYFLLVSKAINSDSMVDWAIKICLDDFQDNALPPRIKISPLALLCTCVYTAFWFSRKSIFDL
jgi:hypothetical protein